MTIAARVDLDAFQEQGFLVVDDVLDPERDLDPVVSEYEDLLDTLVAGWHADGLLPSTFSELPFARRFARVLVEAPRDPWSGCGSSSGACGTSRVATPSSRRWRGRSMASSAISGGTLT